MAAQVAAKISTIFSMLHTFKEMRVTLLKNQLIFACPLYQSSAFKVHTFASSPYRNSLRQARIPLFISLFLTSVRTRRLLSRTCCARRQLRHLLAHSIKSCRRFRVLDESANFAVYSNEITVHLAVLAVNAGACCSNIIYSHRTRCAFACTADCVASACCNNNYSAPADRVLSTRSFN